MAKLKFNPNGYQDLGAYALLKNIVENGHLIAEDSNDNTNIEETAGKIIDLGTITYEDINNAEAISEIMFNFPSIPDGYYVATIYAHTTQNWEDLIYNNAYFISNLSNIFPSVYLTNDSDKEYMVYPNNGSLPVKIVHGGLSLVINFDRGNGEVNQQNYTTGSTSFKALIKKFPQ